MGSEAGNYRTNTDHLPGGHLLAGGEFDSCSPRESLEGVLQQSLSLVTEHRTLILLKTKTAPKGNAVKSGERTLRRMTGEEQVTGLLE